MAIESLSELYEKCTNMVICTTLNQVVNYLPLMEIAEKQSIGRKPEKITLSTVHSIAYKNPKFQKLQLWEGRFPQDTWFNNLKDVLVRNNKKDQSLWGDGVFKQIVVSRKKGNIGREISKNEDLGLTKSEDEKEKVFIWNLTGGQRRLVFEIIELLRGLNNEKQTHFIIYLEGNSSRVTWGEFIDGNIIYRDGGVYGQRNLTLETVFALAGFKQSSNNIANINLLKTEVGRSSGAFFSTEEERVLDKILKRYREDENNRVINIMIGNNVKNIEDTGKSHLSLLTEELKKMNGGISEEEEEILTKLLSEKTKDGSSPAGYLLEYMALITIRNTVRKIDPERKVFCGLYHNVSIYNVEKEKSSKKFCEFDIVLLTTSGQVLIFECKSGGMSGENSKSRKYTAYAVGGVYGNPILITPLRHSNCGGDIQSGIKKGEGKKETDIYNNVNAAIRSARRCNMMVIGMDVLDEALPDIFSEMSLVTGGQDGR